MVKAVEIHFYSYIWVPKVPLFIHKNKKMQIQKLICKFSAT